MRSILAGTLLVFALVLGGCGKASLAPIPTGATSTATIGPESATATPPVASPVTVRGVLPGSPATLIPLPDVVQLSAPSREVIWALVAGQRLFSSNDRGATWTARGLPPAVAISEISFIDDDEGWLSVAGSPATQCQAQSVALWHTADAGATWTQTAASGIAAARCKGKFAFVDRTSGFLATWDPNRAPVIYRTSDGGETWMPSAPVPDPPGFTTQPGGFSLQPGTVRGFGATLLLPTRGGQSQYVYRSTDGGATWSYLATAPALASEIGIVSAPRWIAIGVPGQSMETTDSGATWHSFTTDYSQASPVAPSVFFGDPDIGYATTRGGIQRTVDGGAHWVRIATPGTG